MPSGGENITTIENIFFQAKNLTSIDISMMSLPNIETMNASFAYTHNVTSMKLAKNIGKNHKLTDCSYAFYETTSLTSIDSLENIDITNVKEFNSTFYKTAIPTLDLSVWSGKGENIVNIRNMFAYSTTERIICTFKTTNTEKMPGCFSNSCANEIDISTWDFSNCKDVGSFLTSTNAHVIYSDSIDTSKITDFSAMYLNSTSNIIPIEKINTSSAKNIGTMFSKSSLTGEIDLSHFDLTNITSMGGMFDNCTNITKINFNGPKTIPPNVSNTNAVRMFYGMTNLIELDIRGWKLGNLDIINANYVMQMLEDIPSTATIYVNANIGRSASQLGFTGKFTFV